MSVLPPNITRNDVLRSFDHITWKTAAAQDATGQNLLVDKILDYASAHPTSPAISYGELFDGFALPAAYVTGNRPSTLDKAKLRVHMPIITEYLDYLCINSFRDADVLLGVLVVNKSSGGKELPGQGFKEFVTGHLFLKPTCSDEDYEKFIADATADVVKHYRI